MKDSLNRTHSGTEGFCGRNQFLLSKQGQQREISFYQVHKVSEGKLILTKFTQSPKDFTKFAMFTELHLVKNANHFQNSGY